MDEKLKEYINKALDEALKELKKNVKDYIIWATDIAVSRIKQIVDTMNMAECIIPILSDPTKLILNNGVIVSGHIDNLSDTEFRVDLMNLYNICLENENMSSILQYYKIEPKHRLRAVLIVWQEPMEGEESGKDSSSG